MSIELPGFSRVGEILGAGIYALVWKEKVVYIGQSKKMLTRIYTHKGNWGKKLSIYQGRWASVKGILFDDVWVMRCKLSDLDSLERDFIRLYKPKYNVMLKPPEMITHEIVLQHGNFEIVLNRPRPPPPQSYVNIERRL